MTNVTTFAIARLNWMRGTPRAPSSKLTWRVGYSDAMPATEWTAVLAGILTRPSSPFVGLLEPVLRDVAFALLLGAATIGVLRVVQAHRAVGPRLFIALAMWSAAAADLTLQPGHAGRLNLLPFVFGPTATPFEPVSNVLLFIPLGIVIASIGWRPLALVTLALGLSLAIEATQYLLNQGRTADVNDVIENTLGALIGWLIVRALARISATYRKTHTG